MTTHCVTGAGGGDKPLLKQYHGKVEIPDDLYRTYERFAKALKAGDRGALETMCLPRSVQITNNVTTVGIRGPRLGYKPAIRDKEISGADCVLCQ